MKKKLSTIILCVVFIIGLALLLYPSVSDYWNSFHQSQAITSYNDVVKNLDDEQYQEFWATAEKFNKKLAKKFNQFSLSEEEHKEYNSALNVDGYGIMAYLEIPVIDCSLAIYHGTAESVLQIAAGHIEGTSLPVGGPGTHCVLSGHRGLVSAKLLSDLDKVAVDDIFIIHTLDKILTYQVDQIRIVLPNETSEIEIVEGEDYCTLVTCTPYGINTKRLLVRGKRIENLELEEQLRITADARQIDPIYVAPFVAAALLIIVFIYIIIKRIRRGK